MNPAFMDFLLSKEDSFKKKVLIKGHLVTRVTQ